mgnify:FL=1
MNTYLYLILILISLGVLGFFIFRKPKKKQPTQSIYTKALNSIIQGETKVALKHLKDVVKQDTNHIDAYLQIGNILREEGNIEAAIKIHRSLTVRPNLGRSVYRQIHKSLALDYYKNGNLIRAKEEALKVVKSNKKNLWANQFLLEISEDQNDWKEAAQLSKTVQRIKSSKNPEQLSRFLVFQSMDKLKNHQSNEAIILLKKAIKNSPTFSLPYQKLGDVFYQENKLEDAIKNWEKFVELNPGESKKTLSKIESAYFDIGQFDDVEKFYNRVIQKNPSNLIALVNLANLLQQKGEYDASMSLIDDALLQNEESIFINLMKLKLSLNQADDIKYKKLIDKIIEQFKEKNIS